MLKPWLPDARSIFLGSAFTLLAISPVLAIEEITNLNGRLGISESGIYVLEVESDWIGGATLFDLDNRSLFFTPSEQGYSISIESLQFDTEIGSELSNSRLSLTGFEFPFDGTARSVVYANEVGSITFEGADNREHFADLRWQTMDSLVSSLDTALAPLYRSRFTGKVYANQHEDRLVITWHVSEACCGYWEYVHAPTDNEFQVILYEDGSFRFNYSKVAANDGIVGVFPSEEALEIGDLLTSLSDPADDDLPAYLDYTDVAVYDNPNGGFTVELTLREELDLSSLQSIETLEYRLFFDTDQPLVVGLQFEEADTTWAIKPDGNGRLIASGAGVNDTVTVDGDKVYVTGSVDSDSGEIAIFLDSIERVDGEWIFDQVLAQQFSIVTQGVEAIDFSSPSSGVHSSQVYQVFENFRNPPMTEISCALLGEEGDKFDFIAPFSQFRVDIPEATSGMHVIKNDTKGIGAIPPDTGSAYCSGGKLQSLMEYPIYMDSNIGNGFGPPEYPTGANFALSLIGHELGHTWLSRVQALKNGTEIQMSDTFNHWISDLHSPSANPWYRDQQSSTMGGSYWQDNGNGTFTQLDNSNLVPAGGFSYLDLYLMGLLPKGQVPDFFSVEDRQFVGVNASGNPIYSGERVDLTIDDVIEKHGLREPDFENAPKSLDIAYVYLIRPGQQIDQDYLGRLVTIKKLFAEYWAYSTLGSSTVSEEAPGKSPSALFDAPTSVLTIPFLDIQGETYKAKLQLLDFDTLQFSLLSLEQQDSSFSERVPAASGELVAGSLIDVPSVLLGVDRYNLVFQVISENPVVLQITEAAVSAL